MAGVQVDAGFSGRGNYQKHLCWRHIIQVPRLSGDTAGRFTFQGSVSPKWNEWGWTTGFARSLLALA